MIDRRPFEQLRGKALRRYRIDVVGADKTLSRLLCGTSDASIRFDDICSLLEKLGFEKRVKGSHHVFRRAGVEEMINLQRDGGAAKPYQVRQVASGNSKKRPRGNGMKYEVIIYWSDEDDAFVADVPELSGCMAHGTTQESALRNAQEAVDHWLETAKEFGYAIPQPRGRRLIFAEVRLPNIQRLRHRSALALIFSRSNMMA